VASLRVLRGRTTFWLAAATSGLLVWSLGGPRRDAVIAPGPLARAHAAAQAPCAACHAGDQSAACLKCHTGFGSWPLAAHNADPGQLAESAARRRAEFEGVAGGRPLVPLLLAAASSAVAPPAEIACATCHREHGGAGAALTELDDLRCQACHAVQFASFTRGHPEFPVRSVPGGAIAFGHRAHAAHAQAEAGEGPRRLLAPGPDGAVALACAACHESRGDGPMRARGFDAACGQCHRHGEQIRTAARVVFLRLPGLDVASLEQGGFGAGQWPREAEGPGFDAEPTEFMRALLAGGAAADPPAAPLFDLYEAGPDDLAAAVRYAWAVKELLFDLVTRREAALAERLGEQAAGLERGAFYGAPPVAAARAPRQEFWSNLEAFCRRYFPRLHEEVPAFRAGELPLRTGPRRPRRSVAAAAPAAPPPLPPADLDALLEEEPAPPPGDLDALLEELPAPEPAPAPAAAPPAAPEREDGDWDAAGGWATSERDLALTYRVSGHADPFLRAWLDWSRAARETRPAARRLFDELAHPERGAGRCAKCHRLDGGAWRAPEAASRTVFTHRPHVAAGRDAPGACATCHAAAAVDPARPADFAAPRRATCAACHRPGGASDACRACHRYHAGGERRPGA